MNHLLCDHRGGLVALEADLVDRILAMPLLSPLPGGVPWLRGAFRLGPATVPVVDLDIRLGLPASPTGVRSRLVVLRRDRGPVALLAGEPREMAASGPPRPLPEEDLFLPEARPFLKGLLDLGDRLAVLLDLDRVLALPDDLVPGEEALPAEPEEREVLEARAREYARAEERAPSPERTVAVIRLGRERYALDALAIREFCPVHRTVRVPGCPPHLGRLMLLRGALLQVIDVREALGQGPAPTGPVAVVLRRPRVAVAVDEVEGVLEVGEERFGDHSVDLPGGPAGLLDLETLLSGPEWSVDENDMGGKG